MPSYFSDRKCSDIRRPPPFLMPSLFLPFLYKHSPPARWQRARARADCQRRRPIEHAHFSRRRKSRPGPRDVAARRCLHDSLIHLLQRGLVRDRAPSFYTRRRLSSRQAPIFRRTSAHRAAFGGAFAAASLLTARARFCNAPIALFRE